MNEVSFDPSQFEGKAKEAAKLLRVLSNENRLMILCKLGVGEQSVGELQKGFTISQSAFSQHLAVLRENELVSTRRESQAIYYSIGNPVVMKIIYTLASIYCPEMLMDMHE